MAGLRAQDLAVVAKAFEDFKNTTVHDETIKHLRLHCQNILIKAVQNRLRMSHTKGHDYTGNLLNSIVVVLYQDGEIADIWSAGEQGQVEKPKFRKMTARKRMYVYSNDYSRVSSRYRAEVPTNRGFADEDVQSFLNRNRPSIQKGFCVTVAYTVEYAEWVEIERGTTGFVRTERDAWKEFRISFKPLRAA
jgi:hypothetical protein